MYKTGRTMKTSLAFLFIAGVAQGYVPTPITCPVGRISQRMTRFAPSHRTWSSMSMVMTARKDAEKIPFHAFTSLVLKGGMMASAVFGGSFAVDMGGSSSGLLAPVQAAVVNLPRCEGGLGEGCAAMGEGEGELVKKLQERSAKNYESSKKQKLIKYNLNNFKDYFAVKNQKLVVKSDGKFIAIDNKVYKQLEKEGKVEGNYWVSKESPPADGTVDFIPAGSRNDGPTPDFSTN
ncbi:hypothetical protein VYU27_002955 [Nannochloropsis oceanica]